MANLTKLDEHRHTSEQDYGPWLDAATLYRDNDEHRLLLKVEGGYRKPYDENWYVLDRRPAQPLKDLLPGELWSGQSEDDSEFLAAQLLVGVTVAENYE